MPEPKTPDPNAHPGVDYEKTDASFAGVIAFGVGLALLLLVCFVASNGILAWMRASWKNAEGKATSPLADQRPNFPDDIGAIPSPRLQVSETSQLQELRKKEDAWLQTYEWVDRKHRLVRIPISHAINILADTKQQGRLGVRVRSSSGGPK